MSDLYEARNSIYCYPNSDILKNNFNIRSFGKCTIEQGQFDSCNNG